MKVGQSLVHLAVPDFCEAERTEQRPARCDGSICRKLFQLSTHRLERTTSQIRVMLSHVRAELLEFVDHPTMAERGLSRGEKFALIPTHRVDGLLFRRLGLAAAQRDAGN